MAAPATNAQQRTIHYQGRDIVATPTSAPRAPFVFVGYVNEGNDRTGQVTLRLYRDPATDRWQYSGAEYHT